MRTLRRQHLVGTEAPTFNEGARGLHHSRYGAGTGRRRHQRAFRPGVAFLLSSAVWLGVPRAALAEGATRDLSGYAGPGITFTVSIAIELPANPGVVGVQDGPPAGWVVSNISDSGVWDEDSELVKWPPFFDPSIPDSVSYDVTPPTSGPISPCFSGTISFDGPEQLIKGDACIPVVPTLTEWGLVAMTLLLVACATLLFARRGRAADQAGP
jgi:hypothetical protein